MPATALAPIRRALLSVSDKTGLLELARELAGCKVELISTGGTAKALREAGLEVLEVSALTGFPEIMDGRVKTLHPKVHGGLLGRRAQDAEVMANQGILPIDLLVLNLYPFEATVARATCTLDETIENIDIGGPAMLRAAAKNWNDVTVLTDPAQYSALAAELKNQAGISRASRFRLAVAAFNAVARYDAAISDYLCALELNETQDAIASRRPFSAEHGPRFTKLADLRYGENPHQAAAFYRDPEPLPGTLATYQQRQGKALSYNNIADADAAWECVRQFESPACVIVKHANPCGVAVATTPGAAYEAAYATDPTSAFGGIIAFNQPLDGATAQTILKRQFVEVLIAPEFGPEALVVAKTKPNVRLLQIALGAGHHRFDLKRVGSGLLVQTADHREVRREELKVVSRRQPTAAELGDLLFAWRVAKYVKSNAIVYARDGQTIGIGAGQMSRVISAKIAGLKATAAGLQVTGSAMASDAFFPFRDGIDAAAAEGIRTVIQPGGSMRDSEVIAAADEHDMSMVFTGIRHFRH